jgi:hypothetical protein
MRTDANTDQDVTTPNGSSSKNAATATPGQTNTTPTRTGNQHRRGRSLSWPGEVFVAPPPPPRHFVSIALHEALTVTVWTLLFTFMRYFLDSVVALSSHRSDADADADQWQDESFMSAKAMQSLLAGWFLKLLPSKVQTRQAPGFVLALSVWWSLLWMRGGATVSTTATTTSLPHLPFRICEMIMGRIQKREVLLIAIVHCVLTPLIMYALSTILLPDTIAVRSVSPIIYAETGDNPNTGLMLGDLLSELLVNAAFPVALLVLPVMLTLNHLPPWLTLVIIYPLYNFSVDANGQGSTLSPIILLSQDILNARPSLALARVVAQLLGGLAAGKILQVQFPDNPRT